MDVPANEKAPAPQPQGRPSSTEIAVHWFAQAQLSPLLTPTDRGRLCGLVGGIVDDVKAKLHDRLGVSLALEVPADFYRWLLGVGCQHFTMSYAEICARLQSQAQAQENRDEPATATERPPFAFAGGPEAAAAGGDATGAEPSGEAGAASAPSAPGGPQQPEPDRVRPEPVEDQPGNG
jgi:hypothetical protein